MNTKEQLLRALPSVDEVLRSQYCQGWLREHPRRFVLKAVRQTLQALRKDILAGGRPQVEPSALKGPIEQALRRLTSPSLRPVINATGVVLHTNLGRAPLSERALRAVLEVSRGYSNLEFNLAEGRRGRRFEHVQELLREITGAEGATVFNNNAAAVFLALNTLASGRQVVLSRGELVEIGGSFRIPEVMAKSGAVLKEVGTTNRTRLSDYEGAISTETALLMKVHRSNYRIVGFTEEVEVAQLVALARRYGLRVMYDLGSGCLAELAVLAGADEPLVPQVLKEGVDLLSFSGDKLLGGPQAGILLGDAELIGRINQNPLARAMRVDKMTLAALEATLYAYADPELARKELPTLRMLLARPESLRQKARRLAALLRRYSKEVQVRVTEDFSEAGGGSLPGLRLLSYSVALRCPGLSAQKLQERLRVGEPPVVGKIRDDMLLLDVRTVAAEQLRPLAQAVKAAVAR
jgi:L-seryl-tRNA(Ser) seleniumtransferase